ncbi:response regulator transcription factor [Amycolatopsis rubida]|uniref:Response regulator transcription factor n=1 Tax=Amycolatopsis rubida TaxID=112413 RepID=A0ABX0BRA2_9PSEU|nr:response regulator transcription factor [Amycolatopsis sp. M39]MYW92471.1 response regulator [Amycolatopsis rubida]NEC57459.1 response regulator transcription factor [Amycolatopsis rubida]
MIRVRVVDDHALVREGLALILGAQPDIDVLGAHADGAGLLSALDPATDVVLLDLYLPGTDGIEVLHRVRGPKVVMLTTIGRASEIRRALAAGASGFVLKDSTGAELAAAVRAAHEGITAMSPAVAAALRAPAAEGVTPRERDVLLLLGRGLSNRDIAAELGLAERTVKAHVGNLLAKLQVESRTQAALLAEEILGNPAGTVPSG